MLPLCWIPWVRKWAHRQELAADRFAAENGYGVDMLKFIRRFETESGEFYPSRHERVAHLLQRIKEQFHVAT